MIEYKILKAYDPEDLEVAINEAADDGWKVKGHPFVYDESVMVLMYKRV